MQVRPPTQCPAGGSAGLCECHLLPVLRVTPGLNAKSYHIHPVDGTLPTVLYIIPPELVFHLVHLITPVASPFSPPCPQAAAAAASGRKVCLTLSQQTLTQLHHKSLTFASSGPPATTTTTALRTGLLAGRVPVPDYRCQRCHR